MKNLKKILAVIAALSMMTLSLTACGGSDTSESDGMEIVTTAGNDSDSDAETDVSAETDGDAETDANDETSAEDASENSNDTPDSSETTASDNKETDSANNNNNNNSNNGGNNNSNNNSGSNNGGNTNSNNNNNSNSNNNNADNGNNNNNNNNNSSGNNSSGADTPSEPKYKRSKAIWNDALVENRYENGSFVEVTFKIKDDAADGAYPVSVYMTDGASSDLIEYTFDCIEGYVNVGSGAGKSGSAGSTPTLVVGSVNGNAGDTVKVPIDMANNPGIAALVIGVKYDSNALEIQDIQCVGDIANESEFMINLTVE